jgi:hypothetical protein
MMKKLSVLFAFVFSSLFVFSNPISGIGDTIRIEGKLVLYLQNYPYENGLIYGQLLGDRIMDVMENYVISNCFGGATGYQTARQVFEENFIYDYKYVEIASGMIEGMQLGGFTVYSPTLDEDLTYVDILVANTIPDFQSFKGITQTSGPGCSNLSSWGNATIDDPWLNGETVISRNLDWENHPTLINNQLIIVWGNIDMDHQDFITIGFAGMIGALSGFNTSGIATFQNMGNMSQSPSGGNYYPVNFAQRDGLEAADYNNDGICSPRDVTDAVREHKMASTFIIHTAGRASLDIPAEILEIHSNIGDTIRTCDVSTPYFEDNLIATNHHRLLLTPSYCSRYDHLCDSLEVSSKMSVERNWDVLTTAGISTNLQTIQYTPKNEVFWVSFAEIGTPAYQLEPTQFYANELFNLVGIDEIPGNDALNASVFPNPCNERIKISITLPENGIINCRVLNTEGKIVKEFASCYYTTENAEFLWETANMPEGVYYCEMDFKNNKEIKSRAVHKILVVK